MKHSGRLACQKRGVSKNGRQKRRQSDNENFKIKSTWRMFFEYSYYREFLRFFQAIFSVLCKWKTCESELEDLLASLGVDYLVKKSAKREKRAFEKTCKYSDNFSFSRKMSKIENC